MTVKCKRNECWIEVENYFDRGRFNLCTWIDEVEKLSRKYKNAIIRHQTIQFNPEAKRKIYDNIYATRYALQYYIGRALDLCDDNFYKSEEHDYLVETMKSIFRNIILY